MKKCGGGGGFFLFFCMITSRRFAASVKVYTFLHHHRMLEMAATHILGHSFKYILAHTHTHTERGSFTKSTSTSLVSLFFLSTLSALLFFFFLFFSLFFAFHILKQPRTKHLILLMFSPQRTNHSQITSDCELIDPGFPGSTTQFFAGRLLRCARGVLFFSCTGRRGGVPYVKEMRWNKK